MRYRFCPECGERLKEKAAGDDGEVPYCSKCSRYWFDSFSDCVIVLVYNEFDEVVLSRQRYLSDAYATFTSGYITPGETTEEAAAREVKEELGIDIETPEYAGTYWFPDRELLMHGFVAFSPKTELRLSCEVDAAAWVPSQDVLGKIFPDSSGNAAFGIYKYYQEHKAALRKALLTRLTAPALFAQTFL